LVRIVVGAEFGLPDPNQAQESGNFLGSIGELGLMEAESFSDLEAD
jgi:hypothetical protein